MHVIRRSPGLGRLASISTVSPLGDAMATVALILHLQREGATATAIGALLVAEAVPPLVAPFAGTIADRARDPRRLVAYTSLAQGVVMGVLAAALPVLQLPAIAALVFVRALFDTASSAAQGAMVPAMVDDASLPRANALLGALREAGGLVGAPLAGLLFAIAGAPWVLGLNALSFVVVAPLVVGLPLRLQRHDERSEHEPSAPTSWRGDVVEGLRLVWHTPVLRAVSIGFWMIVFFSASDDLVLPFLGRDDLRAGPVAIGLLMAGASAGLLLATPLIGIVHTRFGTPLAVIVASGLVMATGNLLTAFAPTVALAFTAQVVRGTGIPLYDAGGVRTLIQRTVPPRLLGRALANVYGGVGVAAALGYAAGGVVTDATSPRTAFVVIGLGGAAGVATTYVLVRREPAPA